MITLQTVCETIPGLTEADLRHWLAQDWIRPDQRAGDRLFQVSPFELDEEPTVPLVLSLLDQLYATRRQLRLVLEALDEPVREKLGSVLF